MRKQGVLSVSVAAALLLASGLGGCNQAAAPAVDEEYDEFADDPPVSREDVLAAPADHDADAVAEVLVAIAEESDEASLPAVLRLRTDPREEVRWHVAATLRALGGDEAKRALAAMAVDDVSELVRDEAGRR